MEASLSNERLSEAILNEGQNPPPAAPAPLSSKDVDIKLWREQAYRRGNSAGETDRAKQQAFKRAYDQLVAQPSWRVGGLRVDAMTDGWHWS